MDKSTRRVFFVPAGTLIVVNLLMSCWSYKIVAALFGKPSSLMNHETITAKIPRGRHGLWVSDSLRVSVRHRVSIRRCVSIRRRSISLFLAYQCKVLGSAMGVRRGQGKY
jgi:hypothetical protein